jgi:DNA primase
VTAQRPSVDVEAIRARHPLVEVVTAAGIELQPRGHGYMGCCPFHEDKTPSLSVDGVPDRFHCFGCGASGDVIDFVQRTLHLSFLEAVTVLEGDQHRERRLSMVRVQPRLHAVPDPNFSDISPERAFEINQRAWEHFATPVGTAFAAHYVLHHRGLNLEPLTHEFPDQRFVGHAAHGWAALAEHLTDAGITEEELIGMDLAMRTRGGRLIDTYRNRLIFPITKASGQIRGFIGRDISGHPAAPKYRNPTRTPVFDKSQILYRPTLHSLTADAEVLVVEGPLDALAVGAAAAAPGATPRDAGCSTNGVSASPAQVREVLALTQRPPRIAFDGDEAGQQGTIRWVAEACLEQRSPVLTTRMPAGTDPAAWLAKHGSNGLRDLLLAPSPATSDDVPNTIVPGRDIVRALLYKADDPIRDAAELVATLAARLHPEERDQLLRDSAAEMTRHGWNPRDTYTRALEHAIRRQPSAHPSKWRSPATPSLI